jgi:uncharacterized protein with GYD domain
MPYFMFQGRFSHSALKSLLAKPEDRSKAAAKLAKACGGRLHRYFTALGRHDFVSILELPDLEAATACAMAVASGGHVSGITTTRLLTPAESMAAMAKAEAAASSLPVPKGG